MVDSTGTTSWTYDALNRPIAITQPGTGQVSYGYDAASNRTSLTLPGSGPITYSYDSANRLASVTDSGQRTTTFTYDPAGNAQAAQLPNGIQRRYSYDTANRLLGIEHWLGATEVQGVDYTLDPNGNRVTAAEMAQAPVGGGSSLSRTISYTYDALNRLTGATYTDGSPNEAYTYDPAGNRLTSNIGGTESSYTYDAANRMLTAGIDSYTYDSNGNTLTAGSRSYGWDTANRLVSVTLAPGAAAVTYTYNGDAVRVSRASSGQATSYLQDLAGTLPVVLRDSSSTGTVDYTWARTLLAQQDSTGYYTALIDGLGSVRAVTNSTGQVASSFSYQGFGVRQAQPSGSVVSRVGFAGERQDSDTGLIDLRARTYAPLSGRFISRDNIVQGGPNTQGFNRYLYATANPVVLSDPSGHCIGPVLVICIVGVADWVLASGVVAVGTSAWMMDHQSGQAVVSNITALSEADCPNTVAVSERLVQRAAADDVYQSSRNPSLQRDPSGEGPHVTYERDSSGRVIRYNEYDAEGNLVKRFRGTGMPHAGVEPPLILEPPAGKGPGSRPKEPRQPNADELPPGY
jgi:RHS repeat-associated protein